MPSSALSPAHILTLGRCSSWQFALPLMCFKRAVAPKTAFRSKDQLSGVLILIHSFSVGMEEPMMTDAVSHSLEVDDNDCKKNGGHELNSIEMRLKVAPTLDLVRSTLRSGQWACDGSTECVWWTLGISDWALIKWWTELQMWCFECVSFFCAEPSGYGPEAWQKT